MVAEEAVDLMFCLQHKQQQLCARCKTNKQNTDKNLGEYVKVTMQRPPSGKASALREEDPGFESRWRRDFFRVESYQ